MRKPERQQFLDDIITTAIEGGTGYWATVSHYQWVNGDDVNIVVGKPGDRRDTYAIIHDFDEDDSEFLIDANVIATGIGRIISKTTNVMKSTEQIVLTANRDNDAGDIDADAADQIVQIGLFGELVYG